MRLRGQPQHHPAAGRAQPARHGRGLQRPQRTRLVPVDIRWTRCRIINTNLPLADYVGEMRVEPAAGGGSVVHGSAQFQRPEESAKPGQDDAATEKLVQGVFKAGLDNLAVITGR